MAASMLLTLSAHTAHTDTRIHTRTEIPNARPVVVESSKNVARSHCCRYIGRHGMAAQCTHDTTLLAQHHACILRKPPGEGWNTELPGTGDFVASQPASTQPETQSHKCVCDTARNRSWQTQLLFATEFATTTTTCKPPTLSRLAASDHGPADKNAARTSPKSMANTAAAAGMMAWTTPPPPGGTW